MAQTTRLSMYKPVGTDFVDVQAHVAAQMDQVDLALQPEVCANAASRPLTNLYVGKLCFQTDQRLLLRYTGSIWEPWSGPGTPLGYVNAVFPVSGGGTFSNGVEVLVGSMGFTARLGRKYKLHFSCSMAHFAGSNTGLIFRARWTTGAVTVSSPILDETWCDVTSTNLLATGHLTFTAPQAGSINLGLTCLNNEGSGTHDMTISNASISKIVLEDIGK